MSYIIIINVPLEKISQLDDHKPFGQPNRKFPVFFEDFPYISVISMTFCNSGNDAELFGDLISRTSLLAFVAILIKVTEELLMK